MKNLKRLITVVLAIAMLSTVAYADAMLNANVGNYDFFIEPATITQGTTTFTVDMGVFDTTGKTIDFVADAGSKANIYASLDAAAITANIKSTAIDTELEATVDYSDIHSESPEYLSQFCLDLVFNETAIALSKDAPMAKVTFSIPADVAPGTYYVTFDSAKWDAVNLTDTKAGQACELNTAGKKYELVTVEAPAQKTPATVTPGTATTKNFVGKTGAEYTNVWFNTFAAVSNDEIIKSITLKFNNNEKPLNIGSKLEGGGTYTFNVAIVGAKTTDTVEVSFDAE